MDLWALDPGVSVNSLLRQQVQEKLQTGDNSDPPGIYIF